MVGRHADKDLVVLGGVLEAVSRVVGDGDGVVGRVEGRAVVQLDRHVRHGRDLDVPEIPHIPHVQVARGHVYLVVAGLPVDVAAVRDLKFQRVALRWVHFELGAGRAAVVVAVGAREDAHDGVECLRRAEDVTTAAGTRTDLRLRAAVGVTVVEARAADHVAGAGAGVAGRV